MIGEGECALQGDIPGSNIRYFGVDDWTECRRECREEPTCVAVTYVNEEGICYLKSSAQFIPRDDTWLKTSRMDCVPTSR